MAVRNVDYYKLEFYLTEKENNGHFQKSDIYYFCQSECQMKVRYGWDDNVHKLKIELISKPPLSEEFYSAVTLYKDGFEINFPKTLIRDLKQKCIFSYPFSEIEKQLPNAGRWNLGLRFELEKASVAKSRHMEPNVDQKISGPYDIKASRCLTEADSLEKLSEDIRRLLDESKYHDVILKCGDRRLKLNKSLLAIRSNWFAEILNSTTKDVIDVSSFLELEVFLEIIEYIHSGKFPDLSFEKAKKLYKASGLCEIDYLKQKCSEFLIQNLTINNACECLAIADDMLKEDVTQYILEHKIYCKEEYWQPFCDQYPQAANYFLNQLLGQREVNRYVGSK